MTDKRQRAYQADNLLKDDVFRDALTAIQDSTIKKMLSAKTPDEREQHFQEWSGIERAKNKLAVWASEVRHNKETNNER